MGRIGQVVWNKGKKDVYSTKTLLMMSLRKKGIPLTTEHKKRISEGNKGKGHREYMLGRKHSEETRKKIGDSHRGEKAYQWKGGIEFCKKKNERNDSAYQVWVGEVKKRDRGICKLQNENCMGYKVVHHILSWRDYPEERYNKLNGITLCQYHHPRKRVDERRLILTFQKLVGSNKN